MAKPLSQGQRAGASSMAGGAVDVGGSWPGLEKQPAGTRAAIVAQLQRLRDAGQSEVTVVLMGKSGVGKSATVNTLLGDRVRGTSPFQAETLVPAEVRQSCEGVELCVVDTPGLVEAGDFSQRALTSILEFLVGRRVDVLVYVDRLDLYAVDETDRQVVGAITSFLGKEVWRSAVVVLTRAQLAPSDGRSYEDFAAARAQALKGLIRSKGGLPGSHALPVVKVENASSRWKTNLSGEKILPDGSVWLPLLFEGIVDAALSSARKVQVTERTVEGPDYNNKFKIFIPLVLLAQVLVVFLPLQRAIQQDKRSERRNRPKWEVEAEEHRRLSAALAARKAS